MKHFQHKNLEAIQKRFEEATGVVLSGNEAPACGRTARMRLRHPLRVCLIAILVLALAGAASVGASKLVRREYGGQFDDEPHFVVGATEDDGSSISGNLYSLSFAFPADPTAPREIEDFYLPQVSENYEMLECLIWGYDRMCVSFFAMWNVPDFNKSGIIYRQESIASEYCQPETFVIKTSIMSNSQPEWIETTFGGAAGYYLPEADIGTERKLFCWSDGSYVYSLQVPYFFTDEQMHELVGSFRRVEDIRPYLTVTSEERIEDLLG